MIEVVPVSVVIPCYRCTQTVERALTSVAAQTRLPQEIILVEDGSDDETRAVLVALSQRFAPGWIKLVFLEQNVGAASARNAGWEQASGHFIAFLDADDSWHPRKIEFQYQFMLSKPDVAVSGHGHTQMAQVARPPLLGTPVFEALGKLPILLKNPFITPSFMVRRDLSFRFLPGRRHMEDHLFLMRVAAAGLGLAKTKLPLAFIYKNIFGDAGLSANLWVMQRSELENYEILCIEGHISRSMFLFFKAYSWMKFVRRVLIVGSRRVLNRLSTQKH